MGFDGVEILHKQMRTIQRHLQKLKRVPFASACICVASPHIRGSLSLQGLRQKNVEHTIHCIEMAYKLGIPVMRVNTGRWETSKNFDELMKNRGIEPPNKAYTDEDGFGWVIDGLTQCLKKPPKSAA